MQQPHKRLLQLFLPLLLLGWAAPSFAAQTWTTVWTPGSAAVKTTSKSNNDHESKTNCYPCKEWEDYGNGKGKWVKYPVGTEPVICEGDETDYTCKECDGDGELQDKEDGSPCMTYEFVPKTGCCKEGECEVGWTIMTAQDLEDCPSLSQKANYTPTVSDPACGPAPDGSAALPAFFNDCCIKHDKCYGTCNKIKQNCDTELISCMTDVANELGFAGNIADALFASALIPATADFFESGFISNDRFIDGQIKACICCEEDPGNPWEDYPLF